MTSNFNKRSHDAVWSLLRRGCARFSFLAKAGEIGGHVASYATWEQSRGFGGARSYLSREALWSSITPRLRSGPATVLEFGVAHGAASRYWLSSVGNPELRWHGFDVFTGLPDAWTRGGLTFAREGTFDAGGRPPDIDDPRVTWHVGRVEDTLPKLELEDPGQLLALFDMDMYAPTAFALGWLEPHLVPGSLLYFDEAYDPWHERKLLDEFIDAGHQVDALATTGIALLLEYRDRTAA